MPRACGGARAGALRSQDLKRITVDTTVHPKAITFPTDAKLLHAAVKGLKGCGGDVANVVLSAVGYSFRRILAWPKGSFVSVPNRANCGHHR